MAKPLLRERLNYFGNSLVESQGYSILTECMKVLFYRDGRAFPKFQFAVVNNKGIEIKDPVECYGTWDVAKYVLGYD